MRRSLAMAYRSLKESSLCAGSWSYNQRSPSQIGSFSSSFRLYRSVSHHKPMTLSIFQTFPHYIFSDYRTICFDSSFILFGRDKFRSQIFPKEYLFTHLLPVWSAKAPTRSPELARAHSKRVAATHPEQVRKFELRNSTCSPCKLKDYENIAKHQLRMRSRPTNLKLLEISILKQISIPLPKNKSSGGGISQITKRPPRPVRSSTWVNPDPGRVRNPRMVPGLPNQVPKG